MDNFIQAAKDGKLAQVRAALNNYRRMEKNVRDSIRKGITLENIKSFGINYDPDGPKKEAFQRAASGGHFKVALAILESSKVNTARDMYKYALYHPKLFKMWATKVRGGTGRTAGFLKPEDVTGAVNHPSTLSWLVTKMRISIPREAILKSKGEIRRILTNLYDPKNDTERKVLEGDVNRVRFLKEVHPEMIKNPEFLRAISKPNIASILPATSSRNTSPKNRTPLKAKAPGPKRPRKRQQR